MKTEQRAKECKIGYSTHGKWADSRHIYSLENERGNIVDNELLEKGQQAIWITRSPELAVRYNRSAQDIDEPIEPGEIESLFKVNLKGARHLKSMDDPDGGELWIRKKGGETMNSKKYQVVCYLRVDPEDPESLTYEQALSEKEHLELLQPENVYKIEGIKEDVLQ